MRQLLSFLVLVATAPLYQASAAAEVEPSAPVSIEAVVRRVVTGNPELKFYEAEIQAAKSEQRGSGLFENPEFESSIGRKSDASREGAAWSVSVVQTFEFPGRLSLRKAIATRQLKLAELGLDRFKTALSAKARESGYRLLAAQQLSEAAQAVSKRGEELLGVLVQREPSGITPLLEQKIIEASIIALQKRAIDAAQEAQSARFELNQLSGDPLTGAVRIAPCDLQLQQLPSAEDLLAAAFESNFDLRMRIEELSAQGYRVELARNERYPGFKVGPFFSQEKASENERIVGLGISLPLPLWSQNNASIDAAKAREAQARTSLFLAQREVERAVRENTLAYERKLAEIRRWRPDIVTELGNAAELGDRHYRLGAIPVATYIELQSQYLEGLESILSLQRGALEALQALEVTTGKTLRDVKCKPLGGTE